MSQSSTVGAERSEKVVKRVKPLGWVLVEGEGENDGFRDGRERETDGVGDDDVEAAELGYGFFDCSDAVCLETHVLFQ